MRHADTHSNPNSQNFLAAHPGFWLKAERALPEAPPNLAVGNPVLGGIRIIEVDPRDEDSEEIAKWRRGHLLRFVEALAKQAGIDTDPYGLKAW